MTVEKKFINAEELLLDSYRLTMQIFESGFKPDFIVGLWRGGSPVGIAVQDCLNYLGIKTDHISVRTSYRGRDTYQQMISQQGAIRVHNTQYLTEHMNAEDSLLIVDDVYSSGLSVKAVIDRLTEKSRKNMAHDVRVAAPWYRSSHNKTGKKPDYYLYDTDQWLVLPYELNGLTDDEIRQHKPLVAELAFNEAD